VSEAGAVRLTWLGWSGFRLDAPGAAALYVDPPGGTHFAPERPAHILITHGHPEHVQGTLDHVRDPERRAAVVVAAGAGVCRRLRACARQEADRFLVCAPQWRFELGGFDIDVFSWRHMPLLPPGWDAKLRHLRALASRPGLAARVLLAGLRGPWPWPMLGFRVARPGCPRILVYGEGLHRHAGAQAVAYVSRLLPADLLLAAVEPEDVDDLPDLVAHIDTPDVALYQAHQPWREAFGMPLADLDELAAVLALAGRRTIVFRPGAAEASLGAG